jgi:predicted RecA/RadA family phage recombinase
VTVNEKDEKMKNYVSAGDKVSGEAPYDVASGGGCLIGAVFGVASGAANAGDPVSLTRKGIFVLPKETGEAWGQFSKLYWSASTKRITATASGNKLVGVAVEGALEAATEGAVLLDGVIR